MSLINNMLRDLDARNAAEKDQFAAQVRTLPGRSRTAPWKWVVLLAVAASVSAGGMWWFMRPQLPTTIPTPPPVALAPAAPIAAAPAELAPSPAPTTEAAPAPAPTSPAPAPTTGEGRLKLDAELGEIPVPLLVPPLANKAPQPMPAAEAPAPKQATPATPRPAAPTDARPAQINKSPLSAVANAKEQADVEYRRGYAAQRKLDTAEAISAFQSALKLDPGHALARQALLALFAEQKRWDEAENLALDGVALSPTRSDWAMLAARIQLERGDAKTALSTLAQYAPQAERNSDYQAFYGLLLQRSQRYPEAADRYRAAIAIQPSEGRYWYGLGLALEGNHQDDEARKAFERARDSGNLPPELGNAVSRRLR